MVQDQDHVPPLGIGMISVGKACVVAVVNDMKRVSKRGRFRMDRIVEGRGKVVVVIILAVFVFCDRREE